jgi:hypothetical protein
MLPDLAGVVAGVLRFPYSHAAAMTRAFAQGDDALSRSAGSRRGARGDEAEAQPTQGGILYKEPGDTALGSEASENSLLGRVVDPYTFQVLEELRSPFARA